MKSEFFIIVTIYVVNNLTQTLGWVDPFDMNTDNTQQNVKTENSENAQVKSQYKNQCICNCTKLDPNKDKTLYLFYINRIVSLLLNEGRFLKNEDYYSGHISIKLKLDDYDFLLNLMNKNTDNVDLTLLRKLDGIMSESIQRGILDTSIEYFDILQTNLYEILLSPKAHYIGLAVLLLYVIYDLFRHKFSVLYIVKYLLFVIWIADYGFRYMNLVEEAELYNFKNSKCDDSSSTSWSLINLLTGNNKQCDKKYITPLIVFLDQIKNIIIIPMKSFGAGFGNLSEQLLVSLPFPLNIIFGPFLILCGCFIILSLISLTYGTSIKLSFMHLFHFEFGGQSNQTLQDRATDTKPAQLINIINTHTIENLNHDNKVEVETVKIIESVLKQEQIEEIKPNLSPLRDLLGNSSHNDDFTNSQILCSEGQVNEYVKTSESEMFVEMLDLPNKSHNTGTKVTNCVAENIKDKDTGQQHS